MRVHVADGHHLRDGGIRQREPRQLGRRSGCPSRSRSARPDARPPWRPTVWTARPAGTRCRRRPCCPGRRRLRTSLTPKPLAYTVFPPCTTATAIPGMPDVFIRSSAMPSSLATALSTAFSGSGIAGTSGGGTSDSVGGRRRPVARRGPPPHPPAATSSEWRPGPTRWICSQNRHRVRAATDGANVDRRSPRIDPPARLGHRDTGRPPIRPRRAAARSARPTGAAPAGTSPSGSAPAAPARVGDVEVRAHRLLGVHVDVRPRRVVRADRHQREVERAVVGADVGEALGVAGVAAEERPVPRPDERPRRPQRGVAGRGTGRRSAGPACRPASDHRSGRSRSSRARRCAPSGMRQLRRCAPTPSGTTNGARWVRASDRIVSMSRWS